MKQSEKSFYIEEITEMFKAGKSYTMAANELGWAKTRLRTFCIANNIIPKKEAYYKRENFNHSDLFQEIRKCLENKEQQNSIAKKLNITRQYVSLVKHRLIKEGLLDAGTK